MIRKIEKKMFWKITLVYILKLLSLYIFHCCHDNEILAHYIVFVFCCGMYWNCPITAFYPILHYNLYEQAWCCYSCFGNILGWIKSSYSKIIRNETLLLSLCTSIKKAILMNTDNVVNTHFEYAASSSPLSHQENIMV